MIIANGRGDNKKKEGLKNKKIIKKFFLDNPGSTIKKCCDHTGFNYKTVRRHIDLIQKDEV